MDTTLADKVIIIIFVEVLVELKITTNEEALVLKHILIRQPDF